MVGVAGVKQKKEASPHALAKAGRVHHHDEESVIADWRCEQNWRNDKKFTSRAPVQQLIGPERVILREARKGQSLDNSPYAHDGRLLTDFWKLPDRPHDLTLARGLGFEYRLDLCIREGAVEDLYLVNAKACVRVAWPFTDPQRNTEAGRTGGTCRVRGRLSKSASRNTDIEGDHLVSRLINRSGDKDPFPLRDGNTGAKV